MKMLLDFYKVRDMYISKIYGNRYKTELIKRYSHTLKNIFMINK